MNAQEFRLVRLAGRALCEMRGHDKRYAKRDESNGQALPDGRYTRALSHCWTCRKCGALGRDRLVTAETVGVPRFRWRAELGCFRADRSTESEAIEALGELMDRSDR